MTQAMRAEILNHEREIHNSRAHTLAVFHRLISKLDETAEWPRIIHEAREAGLTKEILVNEGFGTDRSRAGSRTPARREPELIGYLAASALDYAH